MTTAIEYAAAYASHLANGDREAAQEAADRALFSRLVENAANGSESAVERLAAIDPDTPWHLLAETPCENV